ncbi:MAG: fucose isomerase, partial [Planctomycetota bacterium]|jgi:L-fucose isomerase-like protein
LSEVLGRVDRLTDNDRKVKNKLNTITKYIPTESVPADKLLKMAKFGYVVDKWIKDNQLSGTAIQCWTSLEEFFGIVPCSLMSMMSNKLIPSACEVDIAGLLAMYILQLASGSPSALLDWNNNYGDEKDKCVLFHCSNVPKSFFKSAKMDYQEIIAGSVGRENTYGNSQTTSSTPSEAMA